MDTIKILLSLTVALLLGALAMSWKGFQQEKKETPKSELAEVERQIEQIRIERERLKLERERLMLGGLSGQAAAVPDPPPSPAPGTIPPVAPMEVIPDATVAAPPATLPPVDLPDPAPQEEDDRAKIISAAPVVAKITEWVEDPQLGAFATIEVKDSKLAAGVVICVRRNNGILGKLKVAEVTPEGGIAHAMGEFPGVKPKAGDELILQP